MLERFSTVLRVALGAAIALSPLAARSGLAERPFSDYFTHDTVIDPRWIVEEPNPASAIELKGGLRLIASAKNGGSDLWPASNYNASLLLQPILTGRNWTVTTKLRLHVTNYYMGAGIILTTQADRFTHSSALHRFEYGNSPQLGLWSFTNGGQDGESAAFSGSLVWLRLEKSGSTYVFSYSTDGMNFTEVGQETDGAAYNYVGLISTRQPYDGKTRVDCRPWFSYFKIETTK